MAKKVIYWLSDDGKKFDTKQEAEAHEERNDGYVIFKISASYKNNGEALTNEIYNRNMKLQLDNAKDAIMDEITNAKQVIRNGLKDL